MTSCGRKGTILLLKAAKENEQDKYVEALENAGYHALSVSVLTFNFINEDKLADALRQAHTFSGIVLTSPRSAQAVIKAATTLNSGHGTKFDPSSLRCFVVGQATADAAREGNFNPEGTHTGNAENLSQYIIESVSSSESRPLLFPCAQMRQDILIGRLKNTAFGLHEIIAYETGPSQSIREDIAKVFHSQIPPDSVVFFSPSGVQFTADAVQEGIMPIDQLKIFALGPSTEKEIVKRGYKLVGTAVRPDPQSLIQVLNQCSLAEESAMGDSRLADS